MRLVVRNGCLVTRYQDACVPALNLLGTPVFKRASHIDPTPDGTAFQIVWLDPHVVAAVGQSLTTVDERGRPFATKGAAERYEVALLERCYLGRQEIKDERSQADSRSHGRHGNG